MPSDTPSDMPSDARSKAARENGAKSRGPVTPEGRRASSQNATRHGLAARTPVLDTESKKKFLAHLAEFDAEHQPRTPTERELVHRMAFASWRLHRAYALEAASLNLKMNLDEADLNDRYAGLDPIDHLVLAVRRLADDSRSLDLLGRYEIRDRRDFDQALKTLRSLRERPQPAENQKFPNEPKAPGPEQPPEACGDAC